MTKKLVVIIGPTAVGKTAVSISIARELKCEVLSADSRQFYREMSIGTAKPTTEDMAGIPHHFINSLSIHDDYSAGKFETEALALLDNLFTKYDHAIMVGGSGLYVDAVCCGIDDLPKANEPLRKKLNAIPLPELQQQLAAVDPDYYEIADLQNPHRVIRALEVYETTGTPYSKFRNKTYKERPFDIVKIGLEMDREELYGRINQRVNIMIENGLTEEARSLYKHKHLQALQTVGYRELFRHFDGELSLEEAIEEIKKNTRRYAKRQLTWWRKDSEIRWFNPTNHESITSAILSVAT